MTAVAAYCAAGIWLSTVHSPWFGLQSVGLGAGAVVIGAAAVSVLRRTPRFCTPADRITLLRAVLVSLCAVLALPALFTGRPADPLLVILGCAAFLLDGLDGPVARRTGTASAAGARLDTATDAALVLVLSAATAGAVGPWTLCIGALYYFFVAAAHFRPHLREPLPSSWVRKAIGAFQPIALLLALTPGSHRLLQLRRRVWLFHYSCSPSPAMSSSWNSATTPAAGFRTWQDGDVGRPRASARRVRSSGLPARGGMARPVQCPEPEAY
ncbi:CDP-alcohol phosphatidyltransferase family protein [Arthrobacter sp. SPG23]|uniref:CDP-alcohol phosphatidyltransferase family protein n=1 Tax=Arthrobacter sp. SPG23 TaxID=1610703 RepID=UPI000698F633|nr:CDP-alcohol phosphatidyltransferase family protein [Arthrobacter sp. SPG23]